MAKKRKKARHRPVTSTTRPETGIATRTKVQPKPLEQIETAVDGAVTDLLKEEASSTSTNSLARYKSQLIAELKSQDVSPARQAEIRTELELEPLASAPILSYQELGRLG